MGYQIIYLNGPLSSGKTTLAKALQRAFHINLFEKKCQGIDSWIHTREHEYYSMCLA